MAIADIAINLNPYQGLKPLQPLLLLSPKKLQST